MHVIIKYVGIPLETCRVIDDWSGGDTIVTRTTLSDGFKMESMNHSMNFRTAK